MCGILGVLYNSGQPIDRLELEKARDQMIHRGPDGAGLFIDRNVGLAHRRLSIIDVAGGHQPLSNEDGSIWITFNGEIYNYRRLQDELILKGHQFKTHSDTETIVHLYEERGIDCLLELEGMFAFAIWDQRRRLLFAARDRLGEKPFYYYHSREMFAFASEIKALLELSRVPKEMNWAGVEEYFTFKYLAGEPTLFKDIYNLLPGHFLIFQDNKKTIRKYWDLPTGEEFTPQKDIQELDAEYHHLINRSVEERLMSEVPLGTFNSGGIDSSLVTAITSQKINARVNSFSITFEEADYDESMYAEIISKQYNTIHHPLRISNQAFSEALPKAIWLHDEPLNHANSVMIYLLSKLSKESVTVVLTGEGADELFGGYPRYFILKFFQKYQNAPRLIRAILKNTFRYAGGRKARKIEDILDGSFEDAIMYNSIYLHPRQVRSVLNENLTSGKFENRSNYLTDIPFDDQLQKLFYYELKTYLVSILNRADKMNMGASIEGRVPFLDHKCVEFSFQIPMKYRLYGKEPKYFLKRYSSKYLPDQIIRRKKSGFGTPLAAWFRDPGGLGKYLDLLKSDGFVKDEIFKHESINMMVKQHLANKMDYSEILWELINFQLWRQAFFK